MARSFLKYNYAIHDKKTQGSSLVFCERSKEDICKGNDVEESKGSGAFTVYDRET